MESSLKALQVVRMAMLVSIVFYILIALLAPSAARPSPIVFYAVTLMAISLVVVLFVTRRILVLRMETVLATQPQDERALARWRTGCIVTYCLSEAVALYGLVLHFLGFTLSEVAPFYLGGFILLLFFGPRRPPNGIG
jgi:FtsH-binding integral membrane protein